MKTILPLLLIITLSSIGFSQTTAIPDPNFEQKLITLGFDNILDGQVITSNIDTITILNLVYSNISNFNGIEDFSSLEKLYCAANSFTSIDLSQNLNLSVFNCEASQVTNLNLSSNTNLTFLNCRNNQLDSLDVSQNTNLQQLFCGDNQLTSLNFTQNINLSYVECSTNVLTSLDVHGATNLTSLNCHTNQLTSLDISQNPNLAAVYAYNNNLNCLNLKNGNNTNFSLYSNNNPNLTCIEVDNATYSTANWTSIDPASSFSTNCGNNCCITTATDTRTACDFLTWIDGITYTTNNNTATFNLIGGSYAGCDSLVTLDLTINNSSNGTDTRTECDSLTWIDGNTYTANNNIATFNIINGAINGCDSLVTLDLTIISPTTGIDTRTECNPYIWIDGNTYTVNNNTATFNIINGTANGCDSLVTLDLTIINSTAGIDTRSECNPYIWIDGNTYTANNNTAIFNIINGAVNGCDSLVTLDLTIISSTVGTDTRTECNSLTWINGNTYTANNNTAAFNIINGAANGCDSLVTLDLTIINSTAGTDTRIECNSLTWVDGNTYTASNNTGTYNIVGGASNGCDSLVTLNLTISNLDANYTFTNNGNGNYSFTNTSTGNFNQSHWSFGDGTIDSIATPSHTFTTNGFFTVILTILDSTVQGDSCISYYLDTINVTGVPNPLPCHAGYAIYPDSTRSDINVVNSATGNSLTYFWDFGDSNTSTLQNPSHTYATAGPFYLCLTIDDGNGCVDMYCDSIGKNGVIFNKAGGFIINITSPNTTGINNINLNSEINIYPNPTSNQLTIDTELNISEVKIIDITSKVIMTTKENINTINVADLSNGIYFINLITEERIITRKFVKQ